MKQKYLIICFFFLAGLAGCKHQTVIKQPEEMQSAGSGLPYLDRSGTSTRLVVDGEPFLMLAGELHNSTCGGFEYMRPVWKNLAEKNLNTVIATVSWELVEPVEGEFNFELVDSIIAGAREADLKLVLIWFGSWKNAGSIYMPSWVKKNYQKYPRVRDESGKPLEILSAFGEASCDADAKAFASLMEHIREVDSEDHTVVLVQVENEMGILDNMGTDPGNARRDFCVKANEAYNSPVPKELMDYLSAHRENLFPELYKVWESNGFRTAGTWEEVFGKSALKPDTRDWQFYSFYTEELFSAWNYSRYVEKIAAAGKKEYPLPMFVNAWLKQPSTSWPGRYPSGGPLPQVIDIWRAGAPSIDFIAPDIYIDEFIWTCREFTRSNNPLFIPETRGGEIGAARAFYVFGEHDAGCFSPFGIDDFQNTPEDPLDECYKTLSDMSAVILENQGTGRMKGILVNTSSQEQDFELGNYKVKATFSWARDHTTAGGLIINTGPEEYLVAGKGFDVFFFPKDGSTRIAVDAVDEGHFENGQWIPDRRLNGDEVHASTWSGTGLKMPWDKITIQKISIYSYK